MYFSMQLFYKHTFPKYQFSHGGPQLVPHHGLSQVVADYDILVHTVNKDTRRSGKRSVDLDRKSSIHVSLFYYNFTLTIPVTSVTMEPMQQYPLLHTP
jgi:hypothetical protein